MMGHAEQAPLDTYFFQASQEKPAKTPTGAAGPIRLCQPARLRELPEKLRWQGGLKSMRAPRRPDAES